MPHLPKTPYSRNWRFWRTFVPLLRKNIQQRMKSDCRIRINQHSAKEPMLNIVTGLIKRQNLLPILLVLLRIASFNAVFGLKHLLFLSHECSKQVRSRGLNTGHWPLETQHSCTPRKVKPKAPHTPSKGASRWSKFLHFTANFMTSQVDWTPRFSVKVFAGLQKTKS